MLKLFEFLSIFDWITPAKNIAETVAHDATLLQSKSWTFFIPYRKALKAGWNERDIRKMLREQGIKSWGSQVTNGELFFTVAGEQAHRAEFHLIKNNIPCSMGAVPDTFPFDPPLSLGETIEAVAYVTAKVLSQRSWTWIPCLVGGKGCKGQMTCSNCHKCQDHCECTEG